MICVHHLEKSRSERILWLLEELRLQYEIKHYKRDPVTWLAPPELRAIHPLGKAPIVTDGALVLAESGAIVEYFIERYGAGRLAPRVGTAERQRYTYWMHFVEGSLAAPMVMEFLIRAAGDDVAAARTYIASQYKAQLAFLEDELSRSTWLAGEDFTGADIMMVRNLKRLNEKDPSTTRPRIAAYLQRAEGRCAYIRALKKAVEAR